MAPPFSLDDSRYVIPALIASAVTFLVSELSPYPARTDLVYAVEGDLISYFQVGVNPLVTEGFVVVYSIVYPLFLLVTYAILKREGRGRHIEYIVTYVALVAVALPAFFFFPVGVTGYYLDSVLPLLYERDGVIGSSITTIDTLRKAMPSLHAGHATAAALYAPEGYRLLGWTTAVVIISSTLYLGVHWLSDLAVGIGLAYVCYLATPRIQQRVVDTIDGAEYQAAEA
jgi:membrane-associated phospholipid phosphatase